VAKVIAGVLLGLLLGLTAMVAAQQAGSGTGAAVPGNLLLGTASSSWAVSPADIVIMGRGPELKISTDGTVTYQGRVLGTDKEVWDGLRAVLNPWRVCQEMERDTSWAKP